VTVGLAGKGVRYAGRGLLGLAVVIMTLWGVMAIYYSNLGSETLRGSLSAAFGVATAASFIFLPRRGLTFVVFLAAFAGLTWWWSTIPPSNDRVWQKDVAVLPYAVIRGNEIRIHNIRNFHYRSETDYDIRYYAKTFDLAKLSSVDLIAVYWMGDAIAHIMVSFGFEGKEYIAFSIETRKEEGEDYSTIKGFFKQYELIYIAGDERDLIRLRTDYRNRRRCLPLPLSARPPTRAGFSWNTYARSTA
jgi:hypothetical protein